MLRNKCKSIYLISQHKLWIQLPQHDPINLKGAKATRSISRKSGLISKKILKWSFFNIKPTTYMLDWPGLHDLTHQIYNLDDEPH
jgi:hypothetical protein